MHCLSTLYHYTASLHCITTLQVRNIAGVWKLWDLEQKGRLNSTDLDLALRQTFPESASLQESCCREVMGWDADADGMGMGMG